MEKGILSTINVDLFHLNSIQKLFLYQIFRRETRRVPRFRRENTRKSAFIGDFSTI